MWAGRRKMRQGIECNAEKSRLFLLFIKRRLLFHRGPASGRDDQENVLKSFLDHTCVSQHEVFRIFYVGLIYPLLLTKVL